MGRFPLLYARDAACYTDFTVKRQMTENNITPPPELVQQWVDTYFGGKISQSNFHVDLATRAAQWGADQELEACIDWISVWHGLEHPELLIELLRAARRPKPPSLKEQALDALNSASYQPGSDFKQIDPARSATIRRALEQLDD
jgi:hypothetical protein